ncbi:hypothetical protein SLEP1_g40445 [Rubroshorea leprosula]|uniref:Uncharacterized protein n=1 Tax=Rubroshorea leprosula TaxID=152421 RepID=A0AAV5L3F1_9ROSI|nr:hypothetical protein SLEP1_g40445 [Rubroshorea leprosula]
MVVTKQTKQERRNLGWLQRVGPPIQGRIWVGFSVQTSDTRPNLGCGVKTPGGAKEEALPNLALIPCKVRRKWWVQNQNSRAAHP